MSKHSIIDLANFSLKTKLNFLHKQKNGHGLERCEFPISHTEDTVGWNSFPTFPVFFPTFPHASFVCI